MVPAPVTSLTRALTARSLPHASKLAEIAIRVF